MSCENLIVKKPSHKEWRKLVKKLRRKRIRQKEASSRLPEDSSPEIEISKEEVEKRELDEELWLRRELLAQKLFREQKAKQEAIEKARKAVRDKIQKEFEEREKKYQAKIDEKKRLEEEAQNEWEIVQEQLTNFLENNGPVPKKLLVEVESNPGKEECIFFTKTNCCRHEIQCQRNHKRPQISRILLLKHFFSHISLEKDFGLEFTFRDILKEYHKFFEDIVEELEKFGDILNVRTCANVGNHIRGNVFVEFISLR